MSASAPPPEAPPFSSREKFDVIVVGGTVVDGSGAKGVSADVLVKDGRIVHVGRVAPEVEVARRIDARGMVVAPGFIDAHSHADPRGDNQQLLAQGVTTIVIGQDGFSPTEDRLAVWVAGIRVEPLLLNVVPLVGHGTVRKLANVGMSKSPSAEGIATMARIVGEEIAAGAWGLSTALEYEPGIFATPDELARIAEPVARADGVIMSHLRSEDDDRIHAALDELIAQGERSKARVHVAHMKIVYGKGSAPAEELLAHIAKARARGVVITADAYPYVASYTGISIVFPDFAKPPNDFDQAKRTRRNELASFLRKRVMRRGGPSATLFGSPPYRGKTLAQVADEKGKAFEDVLIDDIGVTGMSATYFVMDEQTQSRILLDRYVMIGTDGSGGMGHPRGHGTFARFIREYVVKQHKLSIEEAVRKMSGLPADTLRLTRIDRGLIRAGWAADLVVFDPADIKDIASYQNPNVMARGMRWVLVNGRPIIEDGRYRSNRRVGQLLLRR